jgi:hypothetical protein
MVETVELKKLPAFLHVNVVRVKCRSCGFPRGLARGEGMRKGHVEVGWSTTGGYILLQTFISLSAKE